MSTIIWYFSICLHLVWWSLGPSVFLQMALFYSYLWLSNIPLCVCVCMFLCVRACMFSHVWLFVTLWNVALQASLSKEFSRQEYLSGLPFPPSRGYFVCVCVCVCVCVAISSFKGCVCACVLYLFIHSSIDRHFCCFRVLAVVNGASVNIGVHVSFQSMVFSRYTHGSGIARSYGSCVFSF